MLIFSRSEHCEAPYEDMDDTQAPVPYGPSSSAIISEDNPKFRDIVLRLDALRESVCVASIPPSQPARPFRPSYMALEKKGLAPGRPRRDSKYLGHKFGGVKEERRKVPDDLNCGLWLSGLHPETTIEDLVGVQPRGIIQTGAVYAINIIPPKDGYTTAAASVYFMKRSATEWFMMQVGE
jgi:hypothetical protein